MGCASSTHQAYAHVFRLIPDQYNSLDELTAALRQAGLEKSQLIVGVDFTESNTRTGKNTFGGRSLHDVSDPTHPNPYSQALSIISKALWDFDDDHMIPAYGFGDVKTRAHSVFSFLENDKPCKGLVGVMRQYGEIAASVRLYGPTSFAPLIRQAVQIVRETNEYHILLIVADGQVSREHIQATGNAIVEASNYALSIIMVGVGDGPWGLMDEFDDELSARKFDNFQFVEFDKVFAKYPTERRDSAFATHALMEIPEQYLAIKRLGLLKSSRQVRAFSKPPAPLGPPCHDGASSTSGGSTRPSISSIGSSISRT